MSENQQHLRKLRWTDEDKGKNLIESSGLAASINNNHQNMNSTFTSMGRLEEQSAHARGPHNPLAISQPLKLKSLLKQSPVEYIIVKPNVKEKSRRPMSSSTVTKRSTDRKMNSSFAGREGLIQNGINLNMNMNSNMNNTTGSLNKMMNNFMSEGNEDDKENGNGSNIVKNYRNNTNIPLPTASKLPVGRPRSNQSSDLKTKIFNKRVTTQSNTNMGYGTMNGFMRDQPNKNKKDIKEQVKSFQNFTNPWATFKTNENNEQAQASQPMFKAKKPKKNSITSSDRRILSKLTTNTFSIRGNSPGGRLIYK